MAQAAYGRRSFIIATIGLEELPSSVALASSEGYMKAIQQAETLVCKEQAELGRMAVSEHFFNFEVDRILWETRLTNTKGGQPFPFLNFRGYQGPGGDWRFSAPHTKVYAKYLEDNKVRSRALDVARNSPVA